jgi:hypothetical protein
MHLFDAEAGAPPFQKKTNLFFTCDRFRVDTSEEMIFELLLGVLE